MADTPNIPTDKSSYPQFPGEYNPANKTPNKSTRITAIALGFFVILFSLLFFALKYKAPQNPPGQKPAGQKQTAQTLEKFKDEAEFKKYIEEGIGFADSIGSTGNLEMLSIPEAPSAGINLSPGGTFGAPSAKTDTTAYRVSETNVQVKGIDEPDILKTDGKNIFYSSQSFYRYNPEPVPFMEGDRTKIIEPKPQYKGPETKIIGAFPPENLKQLSQITETGNLLYYKNLLLVFANQKIIAYNVTAPASPTRVWNIDMKDNNSIITSRLMGDFIYLVTATRVTQYNPCVMPVMGGTREISISCTDIYRPRFPTYTNSTYTIFKIDPATGEVKNKTSFLGAAGSSVVYMSPNALYVTYTQTMGYLNIFIDFFTTEAKGLLPDNVIEKFQKIKDYDISPEAKLMEFEKISEEYSNSLSQDDRAKLENEVQNKMEDYMKKRARDIVQSGVAKIDINNFTATTSQLIPGSPLNQFSLDEYQGNLRMATTIGGGMFGNSKSANDVYVLDGSLNIIGSVKDLGISERIYSARFVEDKGYIVTFRQTDPFYVLDLTDPKNPKLAGELKIPGYSGYLHPINKDKIVGVGMESGKVKISLFNVQNPQSPLEVSKYSLDDYYSEAVQNQHAFLMDYENQIFFMPGGKGGYIFSYSGDTFSLKKVVSEMVAKRALYINNFLYIAGDDKLVVLNLTNFEEANRLTY